MRTKLYRIACLLAVMIAAACMSVSVQADSSASDSAYTWWNYPLACNSNYDGKVYFGFVTSGGKQGVGVFNPSTGKTYKHTFSSSRANGDDHNAPAVRVLSDGRIMAAYATGHNQDKNMHVWVSKNPGGVNTWGPETVLTSKGYTTYANLFISGGKTWLIYRRRLYNKPEKAWAWCARISMDNTNWSEEKVLVTSPEQYYCLLKKTTKTGLLRMVMTTNPAQPSPDIRMGFLDLRNEILYDADMTKITNVDGKGLRFNNFRVIIPRPSSNQTQRLFDAAVTDPGTTKILYAVMGKSNQAGGANYYLYQNGAKANLVRSEHSFATSYYGGACFMSTSKIAVSANIDGIDQLFTMKISGSGASRIGTIAKASNRNQRIIRPVLSSSGNVLMYQKTSRYNGYTDFAITSYFRNL